jgi:hypothetical protein
MPGHSTSAYPRLEDDMRLVPDIVGCAAKADGTIWTCLIGRSGRILPAWRRLPEHTHVKGYRLTRPPGHHTCRVNSLVAAAFHGPRPPGLQCRHLDGNRVNNRADNLAWGTAEVNWEDRRRHGNARAGVENHAAKLTSEQVREIRRLYATRTISQQALAKRFNVSRSAISSAFHGNTWREVKG